MNDTNQSVQEVVTTNLVPLNDSLNTTLQNVTQEIPTFIGLTTPFSYSPLIDIAIISFIAAVFTTLLNKYLTDQVAIKALREEMKKKQKDMRAMMKTNPQKAQKMQMDIMQKNMELMKHSFNFKVMAITLIPMIYVFTQVRSAYAQYPEILNLGFTTFGWLGTYLILAIVSSIILKKALKVA